MEQLRLLLEQLIAFESQDDLIAIGREINEVKINFEDHLMEAERVQQIAVLDAADKGEPIESMDFTDIKNEFITRYKAIQEQRKQQISLKDTLERENLKLKKGLLEELKRIIESEEDIASAFQSYKNIHETWKKIGDIPRDQRDGIQKEYARVLEIFFYTMRIYREIKDHDYKRNLQLKQKVLHKLQQLRNEEEDLKSVEQQLRVLQDEWEEIGPVQNEEWELIKPKYWETVRQIYEKINVHYEAQRQVYVQNIAAKRALVEEILGLHTAAGEAKSNKDWDKLVEQLKAVQESYKKIGPGSRKDNDEVWKAFRAACDGFFDLKKSYSKAQHEAYSGLIEKKKALIGAVNALKDSTEWKTSSQKIIGYQKEWKTIGNTGKLENKLWAEFRGACDAFFNARDEANQSAEKDREHNLTLKLALVQRINELEISDRSEALKTLRSLAAEFSELGQVPLAKKDEIYTAYKGALDAKYGSLALSVKEKEDMAFTAKIDSIQASPERNKLLQKERFDIRKQIERLEQEANRMETNLSFFARSKGADSLRNEVENKIKDMQQQVSKLKARLKQLPNE
jgi:hypothetical protein